MLRNILSGLVLISSFAFGQTQRRPLCSLPQIAPLQGLSVCYSRIRQVAFGMLNLVGLRYMLAFTGLRIRIQ
jgi:hypothetical protein